MSEQRTDRAAGQPSRVARFGRGRCLARLALLAAGCLVFICLSSRALLGASEQGVEDLYAVAVDSLASGKPAEAIGPLQEVIDRLGPTDVLAQQMGNAHARAGESGKAALWYVRALRANPGMSEAAQNLGVVMRRTGALEFETGWPAVLGRFVAPWLTACAAAALFWAGVLLFALRIRRSLMKGMPLSPKRLLPLPGCLLMLGLLLWQVVYARQCEVRSGVLGDAIVVEEGGVVRASPDSSSAALIEVPPGTQLRLEKPRGAWSYVEVPGALHGWVSSDLIESIELF